MTFYFFMSKTRKCWSVPDLAFYFLCQKLESVSLSEIVLESFRDSDH